MYNLGARKEPRLPTNGPASVFKTDDPCWRANAVIVNVSAKGLLLRMVQSIELEVGSKVSVRSGTAQVSGQVRHVSSKATHVLIGFEIATYSSFYKMPAHSGR